MKIQTNTNTYGPYGNFWMCAASVYNPTRKYLTIPDEKSLRTVLDSAAGIKCGAHCILTLSDDSEL